MELRDVLELSRLELSEFEPIRNAFTVRAYRPNEVILREGEVPSTFYIVKSGRAIASKRNPSGDDEPLGVLSEGQFFGETGLLEETPRTATVRALSELEVLELDRERFTRLLESSPAFSTLVNRISRNRFLRQTSIFRGLDDASLSAVQERLVEKTYPEETTLFEEGDPADALYILVKGTVRVQTRTRSGREVTLAYLGPGDCFGEMGLVEAEPRSAGVVTVEPSKVLVLAREDFETLLKENRVISLSLLKVLSRRLREQDKELARAQSRSFFRNMTIISRPERCLSCRACEMACAVSKSRTHSLHEAIYEDPPPVKRIHLRESAGGPQPVVRPEHCVHCRRAPCLASCRRGAIKRDVLSGTVVIAEDRCTGCGLCAEACPSRVITLVRAHGKKRVALKCTHCAEHPAGPACVRSCPTHALVISLSPTSV